MLRIEVLVKLSLMITHLDIGVCRKHGDGGGYDAP